MRIRVAVLLAACCGFLATGINANAEVEITALSSRADTVSGGDALVQIRFAPSKLRLRVTLNGNDVTSDFRPGPRPNTLIGLVNGLRLGHNTLSAQSNAGHHEHLTLVNHPIIGPVLSGPHEQPFYCMTQNFPGPGFTAAQANLDP